MFWTKTAAINIRDQPRGVCFVHVTFKCANSLFTKLLLRRAAIHEVGFFNSLTACHWDHQVNHVFILSETCTNCNGPNGFGHRCERYIYLSVHLCRHTRSMSTAACLLAWQMCRHFCILRRFLLSMQTSVNSLHNYYLVASISIHLIRHELWSSNNSKLTISQIENFPSLCHNSPLISVRSKMFAQTDMQMLFSFP
jgi:hypothetical protein